jgi:FlaA1/EpsC-like NDP-sugar epimerase
VTILHGSSRARTIRVFGFVHDLLCVVLCVPLAFLVRTGEFPEPTQSVMVFQGALLLSCALCFHLFGLNKGSWRYASVDDLVGIIQSAVLGTLIAVIVTFAASRLETIPRTVPLIASVSLVLLMSGPRLFYRLLKDRYIQRLFEPSKGGERVLIIGYSDEASAFLRNLARQREPSYQVMGIIDPMGRHVGRKMHTARVIGGMDDVRGLLTGFTASGTPVAKIVVAPSKADPETMERILDVASELSTPVYTLPQASELTSSDEGKAIKPTAIRLDDLLGRPHADIDLAPVAAMLRGKVILVTGGGGSIGSELVHQAATYRPRRLLILDSSEHNLYTIDQRVRESHPDQDVTPIIGDVRDRDAVRAIMAEARPDIVFHAAALKHVPLVEDNPVEGARTNIIGTINVADAAIAFGASAFVMVSTDKAVNPTNVMGATKRVAEAYCQMLDRKPGVATKFMTVRFGNVLGSAGSVVPLFSRQIAQGGPITVTHPDMKRYFMTMKEAVRLLLAASAKGLSAPNERGRIMVLNMGTQIRIVDLANRMIQLAGLRPGTDVEIHFTGLRPGEKLYEERLAANEQVEPTEDAWLQMAMPRDVDARTLQAAITRLEAAVNAREEVLLLGAVQDVVPELASQHRALRLAAKARVPATTMALAEVRSLLRKP